MYLFTVCVCVTRCSQRVTVMNTAMTNTVMTKKSTVEPVAILIRVGFIGIQP